MLRRIQRDQVRLGMYLHAFEGSWLRHPFWRRRFLITDPADLAAVLNSDVDVVVIDAARGVDVAPPAPAAAPHPARAPAAAADAPRRPALTAWAAHAAPDREHDRDEARAAAAKVVNRSKKVMRGVFDGARLGKAVESAAVVAVVEDITAAIERNHRAFLRVARLKSKDEYTYLHSVAVCALMVSFARHLGLDEAITADMGMAGLLHDIGKMAVPADILNKPARLTDEEFALVQTHPERGFQLLEGSGVPALALEVCRHHHEKVDGTGYPHRLSGNQISLAARMGAICDVYDALTSNRAYKDAWTPAEAIARMQEWEGQFDPLLLFRFMRSIEVFPVGMVVQLRSNRLGIVQDNGRRASRPKILAFFATRERCPIDPELVVIGDDLAHDAVIDRADPAQWGISRETLDALTGGASKALRSAA